MKRRPPTLGLVGLDFGYKPAISVARIPKVKEVPIPPPGCAAIPAAFTALASGITVCVGNCFDQMKITEASGYNRLYSGAVETNESKVEYHFGDPDCLGQPTNTSNGGWMPTYNCEDGVMTFWIIESISEARIFEASGPVENMFGVPLENVLTCGTGFGFGGTVTLEAVEEA